VITNLVGNAMKYGRGQPVTVRILAEGRTARLVVADQGIGIPADQLDRIFDRFARAVPLENYGGLGLGLYSVRRIVQAAGGTIHVTSAPGAGAQFEVTLPCRPI
jgi:signal transduction histidine kinase